MPNLPLNFSSEASATGKFEEAWPVQSGVLAAKCAIPTEFGGFAGGFSPEDLFLQAIMNCFIGTFKVYAKASRISFTDLSVKGTLTVDQDSERKTVMKSVFLLIDVQGADRPDRIETIAAKALKEGFILNSVKTLIHHELRVQSALTI